MKSAATKTISILRLLQLWMTERMLPFIHTKTSDPMYNDNSGQGSSGEITLDRLKKGDTAMVDRLETSDNKYLQKLLAMGILPGRIIRVLQTYPAYILQFDRSQAAMDKDLARRIIVKK